MKKVFFTLLLVTGLAYAAYPYFALYQLDTALQANDQEALNTLVDLDAVRNSTKQQLAIDSDKAVGYSDDIISTFLRDGAQVIQRTAVDNLMDMNWFRARLAGEEMPNGGFEPLLGRISYAFFDAPDGFLVRIGELGHRPVHMGMTFSTANYRWQVTRVYKD